MICIEQKNNPCIYCIVKQAKERDHVPPRSYWPKGDIKYRLLKVPVCKECHDSFDLEEDYFKFRVLATANINNNFSAKIVFEDFMNNLKYPQKNKFKKVTFKSLREFNLYSEGGIFLGCKGMIETDFNRIAKFMKRMTKAYFYKKYKYPLDLNKSIAVFPFNAMILNSVGSRYESINVPFLDKLVDFVFSSERQGDENIFNFWHKQYKSAEIFYFQFYKEANFLTIAL